MSINTRTPFPPSTMRRVASIPFSLGMRTSISTTSGAVSPARSTASSPSPASPTTSRSGSALRISRKPALTSAWSSASRTRIMRRPASARGSRSRLLHDARPRARRPRERPARACRPCPVPVSVPVPSPSSVTSTSTAPRSYRTTTVACARPACFRAFVSASWTMRYAERSIPGGRGTGDPSTRNSTGSPASRTFAISRSRSRSVGCGDSARPSSLRTTPIRRRISSTVCRPVPSIASSAVRTSCWLPSSTRAAAPACTTIIETLWAITSWSSRAIRARSTATAACACSSRCASSRWVRSSSSAARRRQRRIRRPTNQVATSHTVDGTTLPESWPREIAIPPNPARNASDAAGASTTARPVVLLPSE